MLGTLDSPIALFAAVWAAICPLSAALVTDVALKDAHATALRDGDRTRDARPDPGAG